MRYLAMAVILLACGSAGASSWIGQVKSTRTYSTIYLADAVEPQWRIFKGTESFTLSEFVNSGRLCEWRGRHIWVNDIDPKMPDSCALCGALLGLRTLPVHKRPFLGIRHLKYIDPGVEP